MKKGGQYMLKKIFKTLNIQDNIPLIIGCSAGPDSMALLHYIKKNTNNPLVVAHINHNLRKESNEEEQYLQNFCKKNNIIFESTKININKNKNIENEARIKRYEFYDKILTKYKSPFLFLAHHGDDLIETILMKIERGSNIEGYAGIKEISYPNSYHNFYIIRPFLSLTKDDLLKYNKNNSIKYYIDKSNYDTNYKRNRYRKNILPLLKEENKNIHKQFLKYSKTLTEYNNYIKKVTNKYIKELWNNNYLNLIEYKKIDPFIQKRILYTILNNIYNNKPNIIKDKHIESILNLINNIKPNQIYNLPNNIIIRKEYNKLFIEKQSNRIINNYKIESKDTLTINNITIKRINKSDEDGNDICRLNTKDISLPIYIRNKKNGDTIILKGLNKHKKVKEILIENKIPKHLRDTYPILVDSNDNILWIPNIKKSKFNSQNTQNCDIILKYCEKEENNEQ